jgi:hypothetical protein
MRRERIIYIYLYMLRKISVLIRCKERYKIWIKEKVFGFKYVNVPANNIITWCTSSREKICIWVDIEESNSIQFFIYLRAELNSQWPITESARIYITSAKRQQRTKRTKNNKRNNKKQGKNRSTKALYTQTWVIKNIGTLPTAFAAEIHLVEGQWLKEKLNMVRLCTFRVGRRMPDVSRTKGQHTVPVETFILKSGIEVRKSDMRCLQI